MESPSEFKNSGFAQEPGAKPTEDSDIIQCLYGLCLKLWVESDWSRAFDSLLELVMRKLAVTECGIYLQTQGTAEMMVRLRSERITTDELSALIASHLADSNPDGVFETPSGVTVRLYPIDGNPLKPSFFVLFGQTPLLSSREHEAWFNHLCSELGTVLGTLAKAFRLRRQDIYDERLTISRELHDSLAQSLTYIKIQISRLQADLDKQQSPQDVLDELRTSVNRAYRELRELMTTFRLTMHGKSFQDALEDSIKEFEERSNMVFSLDNRLDDDCLSVDEEMQLLQVVREALSNSARHSNATRVSVKLTRDAAHFVKIEVKDNGSGFDYESKKNRHHGLLIMQERVQALNGRFIVQDIESGGSQITITFKPGQTSTFVGSRKLDPASLKVMN